MSRIHFQNNLKKPKIALVISSLGGGGAEKVMANLANIYSERGAAVDLITFEEKRVKEDVYKLGLGVNRISLFTPSSKGFFSKIFAHIRRLKRLRHYLFSNRPDVLLSFMTTTNILAISASRGLNVHCIVSERIHPAYFSYGKINEIMRFLLYRYANYIVVQTPEIADWFNRYIRCRVLVIPNFLRGDLSLTNAEKTKHILAIGRLVPQKGFDILIKAFTKLASDFPDWKVVIVGDGPCRFALQLLIDEFNVGKNIELAGFVEKPTAKFCSASILVQPSRFEGFPNALLEAMACGYPAIATYEAGDMLIKDGVNGLLIPADDVDALSKALKQLIENPQLRKNLAEAAFGVRETFSEKRVMRLWDKVLFPLAKD